mmetsp:Transcript_13709/g.15038  ORF Transcript_13709/g.15038 Transcript_13709/m.15038 type:complete len:109 (+) Transcript_13709:50-376(+)
MVDIKGNEYPFSSVSSKCTLQHKSIKKKKINLSATGSPANNALVSFLRCQVKATKTCADFEKEYTLCHKSFMGTGSYNGKRECGEELEALYTCVKTSAALKRRSTRSA